MKPYMLWFGKFKGQTIEQMMFDPKGYSYLHFILSGFQDKPQLLARVREVVARGENPRVQTRCHECGVLATHVIALGSSAEGYNFEDPGYCLLHCSNEHGHMQVPLKFSSLNLFRSPTDQRQFLRHLRIHCGLDGVRLTAERATDFFFPQ